MEPIQTPSPSPLPYIPSEHLPPLTLHTLLGGMLNAAQSPDAWCDLLAQYDPKHDQIVTHAAHVLGRSNPDYGQDFILLTTEPRPTSLPNSHVTPIVIKVVRHETHPLKARLNLTRCAAHDTFTVLGAKEDLEFEGGCGRVLECWTRDWESHKAPSLWEVSTFIREVHEQLPAHRYGVFEHPSEGYDFTRAITHGPLFHHDVERHEHLVL